MLLFGFLKSVYDIFGNMSLFKDDSYDNNH